MIKIITDSNIRIRDLKFILENMITRSVIDPWLAKFFLEEGLDKMWLEFEDIFANMENPSLNIRKDIRSRFIYTRESIEEIYFGQKQDVNIILMIESGLTADEIKFRIGDFLIYQ